MGQPQNRFPAFFSVVVVLRTTNCPQSQIGATKALVLPAAWVKVPRVFNPQPKQLEDDVVSCTVIEGNLINDLDSPI